MGQPPTQGSSSAVGHTGRVWVVRHCRSYFTAAITIALCFGLALFAISGARRTQSAFPRFLAHVRTSTLSISTAENYDDTLNEAIASIPEVVKSRTYVGFNINVLVDGKPDPAQPFEATGTFDGRYFDQDRFTPTDGRMADPRRDDEVVINEFGAARLGYRVGQSLDLGIYSIEQWSSPTFFEDSPPPMKRLTATIVGLGVFPDEIVQDEADRTARFLITPALSREVKAFRTYGLQGLVLRRGDADVDHVLDQLASIVPLANVEIRATADDEANASNATNPLALVLGIFGAIAALVGVLLSCQALSGSIRATRDDLRLFVVFGMTKGEAVLLSLMTAACAIVAGVLGAIVIAIAASPLMPIGPVRRVEATPGVAIDSTVLALGGLAIVIALLMWSAFASMHEVGGGVQRVILSRSSRASRTSGAVARLPPEAATGMRFAFTGGRRVLARSAIVGTVTATIAFVAAVTFATSLDRMVRTPAAYGWNADAAVLSGNGFDNLDESRLSNILDSDTAVADWAGVYFGADTIDNVDVPLLGMQPDSSIKPTLIAGRFIRDDTEIVLGQRTAAAVDAQIGDQLVLSGTGSPHTVTVVGIAVLPTIGKIHAQRTSLGRGAVVVPALLPGIQFNVVGVRSDTPLGPNAAFVRYAPGVSPVGELGHLRQTTAPLTGFAGLDVLPVQRPAEIVSSDDIRAAPILLAAALAVAATVSLLIALGLSTRGHRKELAELAALGFTPRQRGATIMWHATVVVLLALLVGIPVGVLVGRQLWRVFEGRIDVVPHTVIAWSASAVMAVAAFVVANLVALGPARSASHANVAKALREQ